MHFIAFFGGGSHPTKAWGHGSRASSWRSMRWRRMRTTALPSMRWRASWVATMRWLWLSVKPLRMACRRQIKPSDHGHPWDEMRWAMIWDEHGFHMGEGMRWHEKDPLHDSKAAKVSMSWWEAVANRKALDIESIVKIYIIIPYR